MLSLNLLSEKIKNENKLNRIYRLVKRFDIIIIFFVTFIAIFLLLTRYVVIRYYDNEANLNVLSNITKKNSADITKDSTQFGIISKIQEDFVPWTYLLVELSKNVKNDISLNELEVDKDKNLISLTGQAGLRDSLLDLKKYLETSPYYNNVLFPVKNILEKENISFEIKANLNIKKIASDGLTTAK